MLIHRFDGDNLILGESDEDDSDLECSGASEDEDEDEVIQWLRDTGDSGQPAFVPRGPPGPTRAMPSSKSPLDFFHLFFPISMLTKIITATHEYATRMKEAFPAKHKMTWTCPSLAEMKSFLGLCFLIGIIRKPKLKEYWSRNPILETPIFKRMK